MVTQRKKRTESTNSAPIGNRMDAIVVRGARTHNLKSVDIDLPHNQLTVITGVSGSGKSSLAFDTVYAEGQRQYIESLSVYARQFLDQLQRPDVDSITGLQPTLCIDQRTGVANPRSTVATVTEVYDYLRLLMARVGSPTCFECGLAIEQQSAEQIQSTLMRLPESTKVVLMAPIVRGRRGAHRDELNAIRKAGLVKVRVDGQQYEIENVPDLEIRKNHTIEAIVDKLVIRPGVESRLAESLQVALRLADGLVSASCLNSASGNEVWDESLFSTKYACPNCGVNYAEVEPRTFSFNSPYGACPQCDGVGQQNQFDPELIIRDWTKAPAGGAIVPWVVADTGLKRRLRKQFEASLVALGGAWDSPLSTLKTAAQRKLVASLIDQLSELYQRLPEEERRWLEAFQQSLACAACLGSRLRKEALAIRLAGKSIFEICSIGISELEVWFTALEFGPDQQQIASPILGDVLHRVRFLNKVGLGYLTLSRAADSLSGGELQRVRLATSIGSGLVGVGYILDEPSIGLHQRDNDRLIESLRDLQQQGNTVIVVEHDEAMMLASQYLIDMGPGAGKQGGSIVAAGRPEEVAAHAGSLTAAYLRGELRIDPPSTPRKPATQPQLKLTGATLHNLQNVTLSIPLGCLVGITGVSGSGKSSLIGETLVPALARQLGQAAGRVGPFQALTGFEAIDKLIEITQDPIGRSPRSTPATYCGVFDLIRVVWANTRDAKQRGFSSSRFSFNTGDGRCPQCQGQGQEKIEMNFLADLYVNCSMCNGLRYNRQTLQIRYRDRSIADVLAMNVDEAVEFFVNFPKIYRFLTSLQQVGLGYVALGQSSSTLSGGEAQRIKLATELARSETGRTIYFLDEPTTGLHFADVRRLMSVLNGLVERGNTVLVIEHNLDVIRACDWLIDLGPDGGSGGGRIVGSGTPKELSAVPESITGRYI
jgi:excinuclease ABC subunit A